MKHYENLDDQRVDLVSTAVITAGIIIAFLLILIIFTAVCLCFQ